jgi:hypothetical protein
MKASELKTLIREEVRKVMNESVLDKAGTESILAKLSIPKGNIYEFYKDPVSQGFSYKITILKHNDPKKPTRKQQLDNGIMHPLFRHDEEPDIYQLSSVSVDFTSMPWRKKFEKAIEDAGINVIPGSFEYKVFRPDTSAYNKDVQHLTKKQVGLTIRFKTDKN